MTRTAFTIPQGTSWGIAWPILQNGEPANIAGWTVKAQIRASAASPAVLHEWSSAAGTATAADSTVTLLLDPATSAAWTWTHAVFDVELLSPAGAVHRIAEGVVYVSPEVTR